MSLFGYAPTGLDASRPTALLWRVIGIPRAIARRQRAIDKRRSGGEDAAASGRGYRQGSERRSEKVSKRVVASILRLIVEKLVWRDIECFTDPYEQI